MTYSVPVEVYDAIRGVVKDDILAKDLIKTIEKSLGIIEQKAWEQKEVIKAEIKNELVNELATKGDLQAVRQEIGTSRQEIQTVRQELKGDIEALRQELKGDIETLRQELKGDIEALRQELKGDIKVLEWKMKLWFVLLTTLILFTNRQTIEWIFKAIGIIK